VIKKQIDIKILSGHFQVYLLAHIRKSASKLQQEFRDMLHQFAFNFALMCFITD